jgi:hypothetical protein
MLWTAPIELSALARARDSQKPETRNGSGQSNPFDNASGSSSPRHQRGEEGNHPPPTEAPLCRPSRSCRATTWRKGQTKT